MSSPSGFPAAPTPSLPTTLPTTLPTSMNVSININELEQLLDATPATHNIMLTGRHGIGKSEILTRYFGRQGIPVVALFLGQMSDPGDLIGLPSKDEKTGRTVFLPPYWFPTDGKPIVLFLDELNRARPEVLQTIMDLALNRRLAGRDLPPGSRIISAVNIGEEYQLTDLDPALVSRFNIYNFRPTVEEWLLWAAQAGLDRRVIDFIAEFNQYLDGDDTDREDGSLDKSPDRRAWKRVSDLIAGVDPLGALHKKLISGIVGLRAAAQFHSAVAAMKRLTAKELLQGFRKHSAKVAAMSLHELAQLNEAIFRFLESEGVNDQKNNATYARSLDAYTKLLLDKKKGDAFAHWVNIYTKGNYPATNLFVLQSAPKLFARINAFISAL